MPAPAYSGPEVMDCFYPYPVGRSGHLALTRYREAGKYSVVCAQSGEENDVPGRGKRRHKGLKMHVEGVC